MKLIKFENHTITIEPEALLISAFKTIWNRDTSEGKNKALQEFGYMYFQLDPRSDYMFLVDTEVRSEEIKRHTGLSKSWKPDKDLLKAMEEYKFLVQTSSSLLLEDTKVCVDNIRSFLREVDLNKMDSNGKPVYPVKAIADTVKTIPHLIKELLEVERLVEKELEEKGRMRGQGVKKLLEDSMKL